jgi:hypothetical protein
LIHESTDAVVDNLLETDVQVASQNAGAGKVQRMHNGSCKNLHYNTYSRRTTSDNDEDAAAIVVLRVVG